jgi:hypothetical protein
MVVVRRQRSPGCSIVVSSNQIGEEGHHFLRVLLGQKVGVVRTEEVFMVYINRMVKPSKDSMTMKTLVFMLMLSQFPVTDIV